MKSIVFIFIMLMMVGCTDESASKRALEDSGFKDIQFNGYSLFACAKDDTYHTRFTATNLLNKKVSGTVCCGILKGCTVRF